MDIKITITSRLLEWLLSKRQKITNVGKGTEKSEPLHTKWEYVDPLWKTLGRFHNKLETELPWASNPTSGYTSKENEIWALKRYLYSHVHCSIIQNSQDMEIWNTLSVHQQMNG